MGHPDRVRRQRRPVPLPAARRQLSEAYCVTRVLRPLLGLLLRVCARPAVARRRGPVLGGGDAGRLPEGRRHQPVHRPARSPGARARADGSRRTHGAGALDGAGRRRRQPHGRVGQRRTGVAHRARRDAVDLLRLAGTRGPCPGPRARGRAVRRHLAGRTDLQGRRRRQVDVVLRPRRQVHLGAGGRCQGRRLRRHRRQGPDLSDHPGRQGRRLLSHQGDSRACVAGRA